MASTPNTVNRTVAGSSPAGGASAEVADSPYGKSVTTILRAVEEIDALLAENAALVEALAEATATNRLLARQVDIVAADRDSWRARAEGRGSW